MSNHVDPKFLIVDLFCGAGGTTTGFAKAKIGGYNIAKVIACVNHDPVAIKSHWVNHPEVTHFEEDIRTLDLTELIRIVKYWQEIYPNAYLILWASLECTNFSKAKGGLPRSADSRTLANHLHRYITALNPDYVQIENVVEFMSWGPMKIKAKKRHEDRTELCMITNKKTGLTEYGFEPISKKNGQDYLRWKQEICDHGYHTDWKEMNSANFGAYTSRNRLFGCFAKHGLPIVWPQPTHAKNPVKNAMLMGDLHKWKAVKDVLDFSDEGESIFTRSKELSDKTLERIYAGLVKFVAKGDKSFLTKYFSGRPEGKVISTNEPAGTLTTVGGQTLVQAEHFITQRNTGDPNSKVIDIDGPARTLTGTGGNQDLIRAEFLAAYYGTGENVSSVTDPCPVIPTKDRFQLVQPEFFIDKHYGSHVLNQSIDEPAGTIMTVDKHRLIAAEPINHHFLMNPSWGGNPGSIEEPCCVVVARQDKAPLYFVQAEEGDVKIAVYDTDSEVMIKIKQFMAIFRLKDIKMRMLRIPELLSIQGFPPSYKLLGNQTDQKKFIGNSVVPHVVKCWCEAMALNIINKVKQAA